MSSPYSALIVAAGAFLEAVQRAPQTHFTIAADAGLEVLLQAKRQVDLVVGDLDSVSPYALTEATDAGVEIKKYPEEKNESDLELALAVAIDRGTQEMQVLLGDGGRLDHQLANILVLASPRWQQAEIDAVVGEHRLWVVRGERTIPLLPGDRVALHAVGGPASGVTTTNLLYPLRDAELEALVALGISNQVVAAAPTIRVDSGVVVAIS